MKWRKGLGMRSIISVLTLTLMATLWPVNRCLPADGSPLSSEADRLVSSALTAEIDGRLAERERLLQMALRADPDHAAAHWQSGHIKPGDRWMRIEEAQEATNTDASLREYWQLYDAVRGQPNGQWLLAQHCLKNGLDERAYVHLLLTVRWQPRHEEARTAFRRLARGLARKRKDAPAAGRATEQGKTAKERRDARNEEMRRLDGLCEHLEKAARSGDVDQRDKAWSELAVAIGPRTAGWIESRIAVTGNEQLQLDFVDLMNEKDEYWTTLSLLRHAVYAKTAKVRQAAIKGLTNRRLEAYAPILVGSLVAPLEFMAAWRASSAGSDVWYSISRKGMLADQEFSRGVHLSLYSIIPFPAPAEVRREEMKKQFAQDAVQSQLPRLANVAIGVQLENAHAAINNARMCEVLRAATDLQYGNEPQEWWEWWNDRMERYITEDKPTLTSAHNTYRRIAPMSCFMPGTLVWTERGLRAIDSLQVGDRVLSQNIFTGQLEYRFVTSTTVRPPTPISRLIIGESKISASRGHAFWQVGYGWKMAKHVEAGSLLRTADEPMELRRVEEGPESRAHNLVVEGNHTYFVGRDGILVHDNTPHPPYTPRVPGNSAGGH